MKTKILAIALLAGMTVTASARENWQGTFMVNAVNAGCNGEFVVGDHFLALYMPANISNNGPNSFVAMVRQRQATSLKVVGLPAANKNYSAMTIGGRGEQITSAGKFNSFSTTPATVTGTTPTLVINAVITNFQEITGCTATVRGALVQRSD